MEFIDLALKDCHITVCLVGELLSLLFQHDLAISHYILLTAVMVLGIKMCFPFLYLYYSGHIIYHVHWENCTSNITLCERYCCIIHWFVQFGSFIFGKFRWGFFCVYMSICVIRNLLRKHVKNVVLNCWSGAITSIRKLTIRPLCICNSVPQ